MMVSTTERQRQHFDSIATEYFSARRHKNHQLLKHRLWEDFLSDKKELHRPGLRTLDAMCGFADAKEILEAHLGVPIDYTGFDYSEAVVAKVKQLNQGMRIWQQDVTRFDAADQKFELIVVIGGLHHVPIVAADVVRRLAAALEPGGYFLSFEATNGNWLFRKARELVYRRNSLFDEQTEHDFTVEQLFGFFEGAGLRLIDATYPGLLSYIMYYNPDAFPALNVGGTRSVRTMYSIDRMFFRTWVGRLLSFATMSLWQKDATQR